MSQRRVPAGIGPRGGQFAEQTHAESNVALGSITESETSTYGDWKRDVVDGVTVLGYDDWAFYRESFDELGADDDEWITDPDEHLEAIGAPGGQLDPGPVTAINSAGEWYAHGIDSQDSKEWEAAGIGPELAAKWNRGGPGNGAFRNLPWIRAGFDPETGMDEADEWASMGFSAHDAGTWKAGGFAPSVARTWSHLGYDDPVEAFDLKQEGFSPDKLSPKMHRTGSTEFQVKDGPACYTVSTITPRQAEDYGCPGATHELKGGHLHYIGGLKPVTGKRVKNVPGWSGRRGVTADFVAIPEEEKGFEPVRGYVGE